MAMNQVQFQPGLSMSEFLERYGTEEKCEAALFASRWPSGWSCRSCGCTSSSRFVRDGRRYWQCRRHRHQSSLISGTVFEATKLPLTRWFLAMHLLTQAKNNLSALELKRHLWVCYQSALLMKHKLMEVMRLREQSRRLTGRVEVDDAYLGGERSGGKPGRGSENKVSFVAAVQTTESGQAVLACFAALPFTKKAVSDFFDRSLVLPLTVVSDGLGCFTAAQGRGAVHDREVTGGGKASATLEKFRAVNTVLSNLKTAITGTYHAFNFAKYAHRYLAEAQYRFNRRFDLSVILVRLLRAAVLTEAKPGRVLRAAELCR